MVSSSFRKDNCYLKPESTNSIDEKWQRVQRILTRYKDEDRFGGALNRVYHAVGHLAIGGDCKNRPDDFDSAMVFSEVSARDPVFYR